MTGLFVALVGNDRTDTVDVKKNVDAPIKFVMDKTRVNAGQEPPLFADEVADLILS